MRTPMITLEGLEKLRDELDQRGLCGDQLYLPDNLRTYRKHHQRPLPLILVTTGFP